MSDSMGASLKDRSVRITGSMASGAGGRSTTVESSDSVAVAESPDRKHPVKRGSVNPAVASNRRRYPHELELSKRIFRLRRYGAMSESHQNTGRKRLK